jgi:hypothetical protein
MIPSVKVFMLGLPCLWVSGQEITLAVTVAQACSRFNALGLSNSFAVIS